jgi:ABC-type multidrug transport system ATPase subunit
VMIEVDADILLIDEVLAVGDVAFQQKCFDVFHRMKDEARTILFVTHDMAAVKKFCDRAMLIERGEVTMIGRPDEIANNYLELNFGREAVQEEDPADERYGDQSAQIVEAWFEDEDGERQTVLPQGEACRFKARVQFHVDAEFPTFAVVIENELRHPLFATSTENIHRRFSAGDEAVFSVEFENWFTPGRLYASPWVVRGQSDLYDRRPRMASLVVTGSRQTGGVVDLPHDVGLEIAGEKLTARVDV